MLSCWLAAALLLQDAPAGDREKDVEDLYQKAVGLEKESKFAEAAELFKKVRTEYGFTTAFGVKNWEDISKHLKACGLKVAEAALKDQKLAKDPHIDGINGIEFNPPEGWRGVPPRKAFTDQKFAASAGDDPEQTYKGQIDRVARYTSTYLEELNLAVYKIYGPESLGDVENNFWKALRGAKKVSAVALKHAAYQASKIIYEDDKGGQLIAVHLFEPASKFGFVLTGTWEKAEAASDSSITAGSSALIEKLLESVAKNFVIVSKKGLDAYRRKWNNGARAAGWRVYKSDHFLFEYNADEEWVKTLAEHLETIQKLYKQCVPTTNKVPMCVVKVFPNQEDFLYYSHAAGAAAYWSPAQEEIVCYQFTGGDVKTDSGEQRKITNRLEAADVTFRIVYHEGFHQYMYYAMGKNRDLYIPSWINEGMGDYFFGGKFIVTTGRKTFEVGLNDWRLDTVRNAVKKNKHVPIKKILAYTQMDYYRDAGLCYAEGWSICHFLMTSPNKQYSAVISNFIDALRKDDDYKRVTDKVFKGIDLDKLEADWKAYVIGLKIDPPPAPPKKPDEPPAPPPKENP